MRHTTAAVVLSLLMGSGWVTSVHAASLQCGQSLVSDGDSMTKVLSRCGEPSNKRTRTVVVRQKTGPGQEIFVEKHYEDWTYPGSSNRFEQTVTFEDGFLVDVRSGDYGR
jgi:hypothetical protein